MQHQKYEDATGWTILFSKIKYIVLMICVLSAMIGSTIFSKEIRRKTTSLLYTTRKGRTKDIIMKFMASIAIISLLYILFQMLYVGLIFMSYSISGMHIPIQFQALYWLSLFSFTNIQAYIFIILLGYAACITTLFVSMLCSRYVKKEYYAMMFSLLFLFVPLLMPMSYAIFPADMCNGNIQLLNISFYKIFNYTVYEYQLQSLVFLCSFSILILLFSSFQKTKRLEKYI